MKNKKTKLKDLRQADGEVKTIQPTTLDQIFGDEGLSKYGTMDEQEYVNQLNEMNKSDLHAHAAKLAIMPIDSRERLIKTLVKRFREHVAAFNQPVFVPQIPNISPEIAKILAEGR